MSTAAQHGSNAFTCKRCCSGEHHATLDARSLIRRGAAHKAYAHETVGRRIKARVRIDRAVQPGFAAAAGLRDQTSCTRETGNDIQQINASDFTTTCRALGY
jgi:hypothetical protein